MFKKIGIKLIFAVGITSIIIIGVFSFFNIRSHGGDLIAEVKRHAFELSETVKSSTSYDMLYNQREHIQNIITTIGRQKTIRDVKIINKAGQIIYSSSTTDIGKLVDRNAESCNACHNAGKPLESLTIKEVTRIYNTDTSRILGVINPIYNEKSCWSADCHVHSKEQKVLGVLDVTISLDDVDKQIQRSEIEIAIFAVTAIIFIGFIIGFFVKRWVLTPVDNLLQATNQVSSGNLNYTITEMREDELGMLAKSFNNMTKKLAEARMQLFQSDKMASLGRLAAGVAHEINNPLTGVLTYSSFLLKRTQNNPEMQEDLKVIVRETKRSREIVKSLLDFARQSVPKKNEADLNEIIDRAISVVASQLTASHIKIVKELSDDIPKVTVDANQIQQVFINLIVNASDAIGEKGGKITISSNLLRLSPYGITQIKKATCPKRHNLIDPQVKIDGLPSIKVKARYEGNEGFVYLDPMYGKSRHQYGIEVEENKMIEFMCPECNNSLQDLSLKCPNCGDPVFAFEIPQQGRYEICSRKGCSFQVWDAVDSGGQKEYVEIKLADSGCGIAKEDLAKIFEPFFSTKGQKGTGLGLAVIWGIIDNHNGTINVESELDKGTTFIIRIPVKPNR